MPIDLWHIPAKCLERLVIKHIGEARPQTLDPHKFAYSKSRLTEDIIATVLYTLLEHLFIDISSAFNSIRPNKLLTKLHHFGLNTTLCNLLLDLLTNRSQYVEVGKRTPLTLLITTEASQGCVLSPLLYTLYTYDC